MPVSVKFTQYNKHPDPFFPRGSSSIFMCFELKTQKFAILEGEKVLPLDLVKGGTAR